MDITLFFKHCQDDSVRLNKEDVTYSFFQESNEDDESVTGMTEDMAIKWLMGNHRFREMFLSDFFDNTAQVIDSYGITEPFTQSHKHPGDIDLLLVDPSRPYFGIAFECKRVKAVYDDKSSKVNGITKIRHGIKQANAYRELGFHQTYLMIILLDDGRK